jgi:hypothetical protein
VAALCPPVASAAGAHASAKAAAAEFPGRCALAAALSSEQGAAHGRVAMPPRVPAAAVTVHATSPPLPAPAPAHTPPLRPLPQVDGIAFFSNNCEEVVDRAEPVQRMLDAKRYRVSSFGSCLRNQVSKVGRAARPPRGWRGPGRYCAARSLRWIAARMRWPAQRAWGRLPGLGCTSSPNLQLPGSRRLHARAARPASPRP